MTIYIGIDVGKENLDFCVQTKSNYSHFCIKNNKAEIRKFFKIFKSQEVVIALENTGKYNWYLYEYFMKSSFENIYVLHPLHLKRSMGLKRGKNDKIDAQAICEYICRNQDITHKWISTPQELEQLKVLVNERNNLMRQQASVKQQQADLSYLKTIGMATQMKKHYQKRLVHLKKYISDITQQIDELIAQSSDLKQQAKLVQSVPGVGPITAYYLLVKTEGFQKIKTARQLACFAGVVPFDNQSGKYRGKSKVSFYADKKLKSILHMAALSAVRIEGELRKYYERKVAEGKNKMSVLNAVRNKIIHRVYAVIKNQKMYQNNLQLS